MKQEINYKKTLKYSSISVASFVLSIFFLVFAILSGIGNMNNTEFSSVIGVTIITCLITSTVLAIIDLTKNDRKKALSIWALIIDWGLLTFSIIFFIIVYNLYY
ncbi:MAG: hypothetical protein ABF633_00450 [Clostridium sp.]|uniref:hypothetical protein n=1 Tax=Clostridium sp. TaxID=1506 RepID=UPI0039E76235